MATILLLIADPCLARKLRDDVVGHRLIRPGAWRADTGVDLVLADAAGLDSHRRRIETLFGRVYPVFLPVLVVFDTPSPVQLDFCQNTIDLLRAPFGSAELNARISGLLRLRDLSQRQQKRVVRAYTRLRGANRALRTLSACSELVVRARDEQNLLVDACRMIVSEGAYCTAWIGYANNDSVRSVSVRAQAGDHADFVHSLGARWSEGPLGLGPVGRAIRDGRPAVIEGPEADPGFAPWSEGAVRHAIRSIIALPMRIGPRAFGALVIYSTETRAFGSRERELLVRTADSLAYGVQVLRERAESLRSQARIAQLAYRDQLTGLPNRARLIQALSDMLHGSGEGVHGGAVLFIDLDGFKLINDALGHRTGDQVLKEVAARLNGMTRPHDLVGRQGGDEFIVLVPYLPRMEDGQGSDPDAAQLRQVATDVASRVIAALEVPFVIQGGERYLSASIGISLFPRDATSVSRLLSQADSAMYHAKALGGGRYEFYSLTLSRMRKRRLSLETQLHKAVARNEFKLHYQPVVSLADSHVCAVEALLRWPRPSGGDGLPAEFVPILEETGLIIPLGEWVMCEACAALGQWLPLAPDLSIAINLSVSQLWQPELASRLIGMAAGAAVEPRQIELEITEGAMIDGPARVERTVHDLCESGFRIALDDFGTGYSSLDRLRRLPITTLKVDQRFLDAVPADHDSCVLVSTIVQLGHSLGMRVVAEGIENEAQLRFLAGIECERGQGHLFSAAQPFARIRELLQRSGGAMRDISAGRADEKRWPA